MIRPVMTNARSQQQGVSLIMAVFILVVLSMLGTVMINIQRAGSESVAREVVSTRALLAAESGAQRRLNAIFPPGSATAIASACTNGSVNYLMGGLIDCSSVEVDCQLIAVSGVNYFTITSTGRCGPIGEQAVRIVEVQAKDGS